MTGRKTSNGQRCPLPLPTTSLPLPLVVPRLWLCRLTRHPMHGRILSIRRRRSRRRLSRRTQKQMRQSIGD